MLVFPPLTNLTIVKKILIEYCISIGLRHVLDFIYHLNIIYLLLKIVLFRGAENIRTRERGLEDILINNLKTENKWKFLLTGHQNK